MRKLGGHPSPAPASSTVEVTAPDVPLTAAGEPPLSCEYIGNAQARIRRIREWAEQEKQPKIYALANEAWNDLEVVRVINKELRRQLRKARR